jgi:hypothetical protein
MKVTRLVSEGKRRDLKPGPGLYAPDYDKTLPQIHVLLLWPKTLLLHSCNYRWVDSAILFGCPVSSALLYLGCPHLRGFLWPGRSQNHDFPDSLAARVQTLTSSPSVRHQAHIQKLVRGEAGVRGTHLVKTVVETPGTWRQQGHRWAQQNLLDSWCPILARHSSPEALPPLILFFQLCRLQTWISALLEILKSPNSL